jgi:hypothetical protein
MATPIANRQRVIVGGIGAMTPVFLNLLAVDMHVVFASVTIPVLAGYVVRVAVLFFLGGFTAWLYQSETEPIKLFHLGVAAPALLLAYLNGAQAGRPVPEFAAPAENVTAALPALFVSTAWAQQETDVRSYDRPPRETVAQQIQRGLIGRTSRGVWFVSLKDTFPHSAAAQHAALRVPTTDAPRVYEPGGPFRAWSVVLGEWMSEEDATALYKRLRGKKLDVIVWALRN